MAADLVAICYDVRAVAMGEAQAALEGVAALAGELYEQSGAARWGLSRADFAAALNRILGKHVSGGSPAEVAAFLRRLHIEELALAVACAAGSEKAWEEFLTRYRERLFESARAIARDDATGHELADSLYADLYGTSTRDGERVSKLKYYYGLGSLEGWLRTVLAQAYVNRFRSQRHTVSLEEQQEQGAQFAAVAADAEPGADPSLDRATDAALSTIGSEDRYILAAYFLDGRKLAEIARTLGVHESTVSRKIDKATASLRKQIMANLIAGGMSRRQAEEALEGDVRDLRVDVRRHLAQGAAGAAFSARKGQKS